MEDLERKIKEVTGQFLGQVLDRVTEYNLLHSLANLAAECSIIYNMESDEFFPTKRTGYVTLDDCSIIIRIIIETGRFKRNDLIIDVFSREDAPVHFINRWERSNRKG